MRLIFIPTFSNVLGASRDPPTFHISGVFDPIDQSSECRGAGNRHPDQPRKDRSPEPVHFYELHWSRPFVIGSQNRADLFWSNIYTSPQSGGPLLNGCCDQIGLWSFSLSQQSSGQRSGVEYGWSLKVGHQRVAGGGRNGRLLVVRRASGRSEDRFECEECRGGT